MKKLLLAAALAISSGCALPTVDRPPAGPAYFGRLEQHDRFRLVQPITGEEARRREMVGVGYWIGFLDDQGRPVSAENRTDDQKIAKVEYVYEQDQLVRVRVLNSDGTVVEHDVKGR
jgi:hypothetical protein